ncbi:insulin-like growth factor-binding protein 5 [Hippocampus comes]|uniref:insulin-like growth factor-binding protein 5 n=1 Tax=Hippocampus comes TaxID=109280 RepID=UPI00094E9C42|nr:PREDICTED: insulin-like growth factor-binding protein 5 [Hippocampus comes]
MFGTLCLLAPLLWGLRGCCCWGSYVPCETCDDKAKSMCPPIPSGCQLVKEPGCGCCLTCALSEGHACGVYTGTCAQGLRCLPRSGEEKPLHALLHGRGACSNEKGYKPAHQPLGKRSAQRVRALGETMEGVARLPAHLRTCLLLPCLCAFLALRGCLPTSFHVARSRRGGTT